MKMLGYALTSASVSRRCRPSRLLQICMTIRRRAQHNSLRHLRRQSTPRTIMLRGPTLITPRIRIGAPVSGIGTDPTGALVIGADAAGDIAVGAAAGKPRSCLSARHCF